eukprot:GFYU01011747.1.p1 GENE.GFYU01011747.1~~GFYU01011747.1.p1  ORF type:complete len:756 (+),score=240.05 GFYU01011747.1:264-2531(+)
MVELYHLKPVGLAALSSKGNSTTVEPMDPDDQVSDVILTNLIICIVCSILFCFIRRRMPKIFNPKNLLLEEEKTVEVSDSFLGWTKDVFKFSDEQLLEKCGLDAFMYIKFQRLCMLLLLLGFFFTGMQYIPNMSEDSTAEKGHKLEALSLTMADKHDAQPKLALFGAYVFTVVMLVLVYRAHREYVEYRQSFLKSTMAHNSWILIRNLPPEANEYSSTRIRDDTDGQATETETALTKYFRKVYPNTFVSAYQCVETNKMKDIVLERDNAVRNLKWAVWKRESGGQTHGTVGILGCCDSKVNLVDHWKSEVERLNHDLQTEQTAGGSPTDVGFVQLNNVLTAHKAAQCLHHTNYYLSKVSPAAEHRDYQYDNLFLNQKKRSTRQTIGTILLVALHVFWVFPVAFIGGFMNLETMDKIIPGIEAATASNKSLHTFLESFLPQLVLIVFMALLPLILEGVARLYSCYTESHVYLFILKHYWAFQIFNTLIVTTAVGSSGGAFESVDMSPAEVARSVGVRLPDVALFFTSYICVQAFIAYPLEILRAGQIAFWVFHKYCLAALPSDDKAGWKPFPLQYFREFPRQLLLFTMTVAFAPISPIVIPFGMVYFGVAITVSMYLILYVQVPEFESGGRMYNLALSRLVMAFLIYHFFLFGAFLVMSAVVEMVFTFLLMCGTAIAYNHIFSIFNGPVHRLAVSSVDEEELLLAKKTEGDDDAGDGDGRAPNPFAPYELYAPSVDVDEVVQQVVDAVAGGNEDAI